LQSLLLLCGVVYGVLLLLKDPKTALHIYLVVFCITFDLTGLCFLTNKLIGGFEIQYNAVSVVNFITAIGLSVEFCVHIMLQYNRSNGTAEEKAKEAVRIMGSSIFIGIICTKFLGHSFTYFSRCPRPRIR